MRRTLIGLAAAGVLLVSACSDSDSGGPDDASDEAANDSEGGGDGGGDGASEGFCADFEALNEQFTNDPEASSDPNTVIEGLESLEPPEDIAEDFEVLVDFFRQTADIDVNDPEAAAEAQALSEESAESQERVSTYLADECGISPSG